MVKYGRLIWVILFIVGASARSYDIVHPVDTELWREYDVSTIAKNFYQNHFDIFHPQIAWDGSGPGYTEAEFQVYSYLTAISYKIFGFWEPTGRVISFMFSLASMLVFFRLSKYLFYDKTAIAVSSFFALSPILLITANSIRPESVMFFLYLCSAYTFVRWINDGSKKYYLLAILFTALALLCKITAANIGGMFVFLIIFKKGWKFLLRPQVIIMGMLIVLPSILWYHYCHKFYVLYGNSLGVSNEYAWIGKDFFTSIHFIKGLLKIEILNVWTLPGFIIILLSLAFTKMIKNQNTLLAISWIFSVYIFYIIACRITAEDWAYYYHIFSIPAVSILLGISFIELYNKYKINLKFKENILTNRSLMIKSRAIIFSILTLAFCFVISSFRYTFRLKNTNEFQTSDFYACKDSLIKLIPPNSLLLASGAQRVSESGHSHAYNISYFFYWLHLKGYNISAEDQSIKNVLQFKAKGASFFLAEERLLKFAPGFEDALRKNFKPVFQSNGCILFDLNKK